MNLGPMSIIIPVYFQNPGGGVLYPWVVVVRWLCSLPTLVLKVMRISRWRCFCSGLALLGARDLRLQGLAMDLWAVSKGQKELKLVRPKGTVACQVQLKRVNHVFDMLTILMPVL